MKKKLLVVIVLCVCFLVGCGKYTKDDALKDLTKKIDKASAYYLEGTMEIINNEDIYKYDVKVSYKDGDFYKVNLKNLSNDHEQIILRNTDGVYVITPSLNKSFKFQSEWPYNNSQIYLLGSILEDIKEDKEHTYEYKDSYHIFTSKVNYPNNKKLVKQTVFIDDKLNIKEVQITDDKNIVVMKMTFSKIDLKPEFKKDYFKIDEILETTFNDDDNETTKIDDIIYPMYLPINTYLTGKDTIEEEGKERLILTFDGDNPFVLIEEIAKIEKEHIVIPTSGEMEQLVDTIAVINDNSINWVSNGIEYYVISKTMALDELLEVARSISVLPVSK